MLSRLLTAPPPEAVTEAVEQLTALGALQQQQQKEEEAGSGGVSESLTPLGQHLADMPMDAALGKALLYGCMLRYEVEWGGGEGGRGEGKRGGGERCGGYVGCVLSAVESRNLGRMKA